MGNIKDLDSNLCKLPVLSFLFLLLFVCLFFRAESHRCKRQEAIYRNPTDFVQIKKPTVGSASIHFLILHTPVGISFCIWEEHRKEKKPGSPHFGISRKSFHGTRRDVHMRAGNCHLCSPQKPSDPFWCFGEPQTSPFLTHQCLYQFLSVNPN